MRHGVMALGLGKKHAWARASRLLRVGEYPINCIIKHICPILRVCVCIREI